MNEVDAIFNAFGRACRFVHLQDEYSKKTAQIREIQERKCGNCRHWMKSSCKPEKELKQFKSCNSYACKDFELKDNSLLMEKFTAELAEIKTNLDEAWRIKP